MKRRILILAATLLTLMMCVGIFSACDDDVINVKDTEGLSSSETENVFEENSELQTGEVSDEENTEVQTDIGGGEQTEGISEENTEDLTENTTEGQTEDSSEIPTLSECEMNGHKWADATCTVPKTCKVCNETDGEALGHDEISHEGKAPTCTNDGWKAYVTCSRCDYTTYEKIGKMGHKWADRCYLHIAEDLQGLQGN